MRASPRIIWRPMRGAGCVGALTPKPEVE